MVVIGHKTVDIFGEYTEYSIKGTPKKLLKIVIQKGKDISHPFYGIWYIYKFTPDIVEIIGWGTNQRKAEQKARNYIRKELKIESFAE